MHRPRSKRSQIIRSTVVYTVMVTVILAGLAFGVLYTMGYRINTSDGSIAQGGLLQVAAIPSGARVTMDNQLLSGSSPMRIDARAGSHTLQISRDGYRPWQKTVTVDPGTVHWVNYPRLVPLQPVEKVQASFSELAAVLPAAKRDVIVAQPTLTEALFQRLEIGGDTVSKVDLRLPSNLVELPDEAKVSYRMMQWDESDRLILVEYTYDKSRGWVVLDTRSPENSVNVTALLDDPTRVSQIMFDERNGRALYVLANGVIRRLDISSRSLSAPLARDAQGMWQSHDGVVTFASKLDDKGYRTVGYYTQGAATSRTLQKFRSFEGETVRIAIGEYIGRQYVAVQRATAVEVSRLSLHASDSRSELELTRLATITTPEAARELSFSPHDRFVYVQYGATFTVYDIELDKMSISTVQGDEPIDKTLGWLDRYHVWSDRGERLRWYEFDGDNAQDIAAAAPGYAPKLTRNDRYLYVIQSAERGGFNLVRVSLRL